MLQSRLPEIEALQEQLTQTQKEMSEAGFKAQDEKAAAEVRQQRPLGALWDSRLARSALQHGLPARRGSGHMLQGVQQSMFYMT